MKGIILLLIYIFENSYLNFILLMFFFYFEDENFLRGEFLIQSTTTGPITTGLTTTGPITTGSNEETVCITGVADQFPQAIDVEQYAQNLFAGVQQTTIPCEQIRQQFGQPILQQPPGGCPKHDQGPEAFGREDPCQYR